LLIASAIPYKLQTQYDFPIYYNPFLPVSDVISINRPVSLLLYNGQVIHFLVDTVNLYLSFTWGTTQAECACHQDPDPLLNISGSGPVSHCQCVVPADECAYQVAATDPDDISDDDLEWRGASYQGNVTSLVFESRDNVTDWLYERSYDNNFQYVSTLCLL
jgi:hypothetical protein